MDQDKANVYILASTSDVLAKKHESMVTAREIMDSLQDMFGQPSIQARHNTLEFIYNSCMKERTSVREHVLNLMVHFIVAEVNGAVIDEGSQMSIRTLTRNGYRAKEPLELVHSELCGSMNVTASGRYEYFISFIDDYLRYEYLYVMQHQSETLKKFKEYKAEVDNQLGKTIKTLQSDQGGKYMNLKFQDYMIEREITSQL
ncbi:uncharacterized protein LOC111023556 [Momordica charantia]|uniref:Uncharacterized protein LOC111023556 n=1 Tax=Momordica charantia TaxID=3673 RepID=A0A6J1DSP2_MOMCH|nr:uncharacterized protein LOC111023556 [Momordica charantia]